MLAGHGSRSSEANDALHALAATLAVRLGRRVHVAFLEFTEPTIPDTIAAAVAGGASNVVVVPYFLSPGMHVRRDLAGIAEAASREHGVPVALTDFLGAHPAIVDLLAEIATAPRP